MQKPGPLPILWWALSGLTLFILLLYSYAYLFLVPYLGVSVQFFSGVVLIYSQLDAETPALQVDDQILAVEGVNRGFLTGNRDRVAPLFGEYEPGDVLELNVNRGDQVLDVEWTVADPNVNEVGSRLFDLWWLAYIFWGFGVFTLVAVWIRDQRWRLLVWFYHLASVWIISGVLSVSLMYYSSLVMHALTWLLVAVMLHLHWIFPRPFERSHRRNGMVIRAIYIISFALALAELFQWMPWSAYLLAIGIALLGSLVFLVMHYRLQPDSRWAVRVVLSAVIMVILGGVAFNFIGRLSGLPNIIDGGVLFAPLIPAAYFYAIMRRRMGVYEAVLNRLVAAMVYALLLLATLIMVFALLSLIIEDFTNRLMVMSGVVVIVAGLGMFFYGQFRRMIESRFLGIQQSVDELVQAFGHRLVTRLSFDQLVDILSEEVMPSLGIHQGALLKLVGFDGNAPPDGVELLDSAEVDASDMPAPEDILPLLEQSKRYRPPPEEGLLVQPCPWVRLVLPMLHEGKIVGLCLLGHRDPDDFYSQSEIPAIQALVDQTSLALANIEQAEFLLALSRRSIAHREAEHRNLAHELHDEVLAQMAVLAQSMSEPSDAFIQAYQDAVQRIRDVISGLRPATLEQLGLHTALEELLDDLTERSERMNGAGPALALDLNPERRRYDPDVELHMYRIVQQASYNVLEHAQAKKLSIIGRLEENGVEILVVDDGIGFPEGVNPDMEGLLTRQHFGLVTMHERANLIGAQVNIQSSPGRGTNVKVVWRGQDG